ncbi:mesaconyl-C4 CoA hydratase [Humibacillus sp. DSM 29435]|uniref:FAS1-like dehydratase domain-containing protein n=1 Tax=Humibacillus sp. DSM 29435 TaxID=1869167 RepID=UPI000872EFF6|nr:MaoC family dehydratase N-terminal domain-containing protein [Humibacillus sp. DSM 29435]OFE18654.1 mesaconyl-C4 CoA hydratase [Humibacillus sp. DSM 29435]
MTATPDSLTRTEVIGPEPSASLAALLDIDAPTDGLLPELWHWVHLLARPRESLLGVDGHPVSGIPAPPGPGRRRMFAGGRVTTLRRLRIGEEAVLVSRVESTAEKHGRSGPLTFVTVRNEVRQGGALAVVDEQDIVYRAGGTQPLPATAPADASIPVRSQRLDLAVDERLLFRFSAVTFNAHRIHYDLDWARHEGYDGLVIHGPLQALLMGEVTRRNGVSLVGREFAYRLLVPLTRPQVVTAVSVEPGVEHGAQVFGAAGHLTATSTLTPA